VSVTKLPGTKLSAKEMYSLPGLVESVPQAKYDFSAGPTISRFLKRARYWAGNALGAAGYTCRR